MDIPSLVLTILSLLLATPSAIIGLVEIKHLLDKYKHKQEKVCLDRQGVESQKPVKYPNKGE